MISGKNINKYTYYLGIYFKNLCTFFSGTPMLLLEMTLGQYSALAPTKLYRNLCPVSFFFKLFFLRVFFLLWWKFRRIYVCEAFSCSWGCTDLFDLNGGWVSLKSWFPKQNVGKTKLRKMLIFYLFDRQIFRRKYWPNLSEPEKPRFRVPHTSQLTM